LQKKKIEHTVHQYIHDPSSSSYGEEAAEKLGIEQSKVFKTLVVLLDEKELAVGIVPVSSKLSLKSIAKTLGVKKAVMADTKIVENTTGYIVGGVSPIGQKKRLRTVIDTSAKNYDTIFVSGGKRGLEVELSSDDLEMILNAKFANIVL